MFESILAAAEKLASGQVALDHVASIIRNHRIQSSPGFRAAARYCRDVLLQAGVEAEIVSYPADGYAAGWSSLNPQEWQCESGRLCLIDDSDSALDERIRHGEVLADYRSMPLSIIQRSCPTPPEGVVAEIVSLDNDLDEASYDATDVRGKIVLTSSNQLQMHELAIEKHGAAGLLFDGMNEIAHVRSRSDLAGALQYTSFWWYGDPEAKTGWGFVISPETGDRLRARLRQGRKLVAWARIDSRFVAGTMDVVRGRIAGNGTSEEEVVLVAHLCHPQPSANDNASGDGALLETASVLQRMIDEGYLPRPRRSIRFLMPPEMHGTWTYLAESEAERAQMAAALNLDMVGENQDLTKSTLIVERPPLSAPGYVADLLEAILTAIGKEVPSLGGQSYHPLFRWAGAPFGGGSDHYILSDPSVGVPCPMLIQWPDKFYHTSYDTLDKVDPAMLQRVVALAATYIYFLANAGTAEVIWLASEMVARFQQRISVLVQEQITAALDVARAGSLTEATVLAGLRRRLSFLAECEARSFAGLGRFAENGVGANTYLMQCSREVEQIVENAWQHAVAFFATRGIELDAVQEQRSEDAWEEEAKQLVVQRRWPGPLSVAGHLHKLHEDERQEYGRLFEGRRQAYYFTVALYWVDGKRTLAEVAELTELETGIRDGERLVRYMQLLERAGLVTLERSGVGVG